MEAVLNAQDLVNPIEAPTIPTPDVPETPSEFVQRSGIIQANTEESQQRDQVFSQLQESGNTPSFENEFQGQLNQFGTPDAVNSLRDVQSQLAKLNTSFDIQGSQIADGNSIGQAQREVSQNDRERAIRTAGLSAQAELLQGNIQTAQSIARDTVNFAFQDEQLRLNQLGKQYDALQDRVSGQEAQLLEQRRNELEQEQANLANLQSNVESAIASGGASPSDMAVLTDTNRSREERLALAQQIVARTTAGDRQRDIAVKNAQLRNANRKQTSVVEVGGSKQLINTQTGEVIATYGQGDLEGVEPMTQQQEFSETKSVNEIAGLTDHEGLNSAVGPIALARVPVGDAFGAKDDFIGSVENMVKNLTLLTYAEAKEQGLTFGAMSQGEWDILAQSATKISQWREYEDDDPTKQVVGYDVNETAFKGELDSLTQFAKLGFINKGGDPESVGVIVTEDGAYWTQNSDGSLTQIK